MRACAEPDCRYGEGCEGAQRRLGWLTELYPQSVSLMLEDH